MRLTPVRRGGYSAGNPSILWRLTIAVLLSLVIGVESLSGQNVPGTTSAGRPTVALVLSGGGALGLAHIGVIEALEEMGVPIDIVVGTSIGAMVGGAYAIGYSPQDMKDFVSRVDWKLMFSEDPPLPLLNYQKHLDKSRYFLDVPFDRAGIKLKSGLLSGQNITALLDRMTFQTPVQANFDQFPRRFRAVATDIGTGREKVFSGGSLSDAIRASTNLPALFAPYVVDGHYYVDGGVVDQLPIDVAKSMGADIIIAVDFGLHLDANGAQISNNPLASVQRSMDIMVNANVQRQLKDADLVIRPDTTGFSATRIDRWKELIERGRAAVVAEEAEVKRLLARTGQTAADPQRRGVYFTKNKDSILERVKVSGGSLLDRTKALQLFTPMIGAPRSADAFSPAVDQLLQTGSFDLVKLRKHPLSDGEFELDVELVPRSTGINSLQFGIAYRSTYANSIYSQLKVMDQIAFRDLSGPGSEWSVEGDLFDSLGFHTRYYQPFSQWSFVQANFDLTRSDEILDGYLVPGVAFNLMTVGASLGVEPLPGSRIAVGADYRQHNYGTYENPSFSSNDSGVRSVFQTSSFDRRDSPLFPMEGWALTNTFRVSLPGPYPQFTVFAAMGEAGLSLNTPFSVFVLGKVGTDFEHGAVSNSVPIFDLPTLPDRRMFPGLINTLDGTGNQIAAAGIELKLRIDQIVPGFLFPMFLVAQAASGLVLNTGELNQDLWNQLQWNSGVGAGFRFLDSLGILVRAGVAYSSQMQSPYVSIDFGSGDSP